MGSGVMRVMPGDPVGTRFRSHLTSPNRLLTLCLLLCCAPPAQNCKSDVIPVDMVGNMTIAAAYYVGTRSVEVGLVACSKSGGGGQSLIVMCISTPTPAEDRRAHGVQLHHVGRQPVDLGRLEPGVPVVVAPVPAREARLPPVGGVPFFPSFFC